MRTGSSVGRAAAALGIAAFGAALAWPGAGAGPLGAGVKDQTAQPGRETAWPTCPPAPSPGAGEGTGMERTGTLRTAAERPRIDIEAPSRTERATFALG